MFDNWKQKRWYKNQSAETEKALKQAKKDYEGGNKKAETQISYLEDIQFSLDKMEVFREEARLLSTAQRLDIEFPSKTNASLWIKIDSGEVILTMNGVAHFKNEIRRVKNERWGESRNNIKWFLWVVGAVLGILGVMKVLL